MTSDKFGLKRKTAAPLADGEAADDLARSAGCEACRTGRIMLEIRHKDGRVTAKGYSWLQSAEFDPSEGITLNFSGEIDQDHRAAISTPRSVRTSGCSPASSGIACRGFRRRTERM